MAIHGTNDNTACGCGGSDTPAPSGLFKGYFATFLALTTAHPAPEDGSYAMLSVAGSDDNLCLWDKGDVKWRTYEANNILLQINVGYITDPGDGTFSSPAAVVVLVNSVYGFVVSAYHSPVLITGFRTVDGVIKEKLRFFFKQGKGKWGSGGTAINTAMLEGMPPEVVAQDDVENAPNTITTVLGDISGSDFLTVMNAEVSNFDEPENVYLVTYTLDGSGYIQQFIGEGGNYGGGVFTDLTEDDFVLISGPGITNSGINSVIGESVDNTDPLNPVVKAIPIGGTNPGSPVLGDIEIGAGEIPISIKRTTEAGVARVMFSDDGFLYIGRNIVSGDGVFSLRSYIEMGEGNFSLVFGANAIGTGPGGFSSSTDFTPFLTDSHFTQKKYVDQAILNAIDGLNFKKEVRVASTANVTIATAPATIDGVTLMAGDRILLKNQTAGTENGIYIFNGGGAPLTRSLDANTGEELTNRTIPVTSGTTNQDTWWTVRNDSITLGTTVILFTQTGGSSTYASGTGLILSGNVFYVDTTWLQTQITSAITGKADKETLYRDNTEYTAAGVTTEQIVSSYAIGANQLQNGSLPFKFDFQKTGTAGIVTVKVYRSTSATSFAGALQLAQAGGTAAQLYVPISREHILKADGTIFGFPANNSSANDLVANASAVLSAAYDKTTAHFIIVTVQLASASDTVVQKFGYIANPKTT